MQTSMSRLYVRHMHTSCVTVYLRMVSNQPEHQLMTPLVGQQKIRELVAPVQPQALPHLRELLGPFLTQPQPRRLQA